MTVLFADISGYSSLGERLDPEELAEVTNRCFRALGEEIDREGGTVDKFMGDAVLAIFGAPVAHEDDPIRAVRAALSMQSALDRINPQLLGGSQVGIKIRIGINTGLVLAGEIGSEHKRQYTVIGDTVNLASRLQEMAQIGAVLVSEPTYRLIHHLFDCEPLELAAVRGRSEPVVAYQVVEEKALPLSSRGVAGMPSPFVGRQTELDTLNASFSLALGGHPQVVSIIGEPGIGKTRLVSEFIEPITKDSSPIHTQYLRGYCPSHAGEAYGGFVSLLKNYFRLTPNDDVAEATAKITSGLEDVGLEPAPLTPLLSHFLGIAELSSKGTVSKGIRERMYRAIEQVILSQVQKGPVVAIIEDLHWADTATLDLLHFILRRLPPKPLLFLLLYRPTLSQDFRWLGKIKHTVLRLQPLLPQDSFQMLENLFPLDSIPQSLKEIILLKSEGNPFFIEEVIHSLIDDGTLKRAGAAWVCTRDISAIDIPPTVQGVILARLDRLEAKAKEVLQEGAIIGRTFQHRLLREVSEVHQELDSHLAKVESADLVRRHRGASETEYSFKHILTQEVAYNSTLLRKRLEFHKRVAMAIERLYADRLQDFAEALAYHYARAGVKEKAADYFLQAGNKADKVGAEREARRFRQRAKGLWRRFLMWPFPVNERPTRRQAVVGALFYLLLPVLLVGPAIFFSLLFTPLGFEGAVSGVLALGLGLGTPSVPVLVFRYNLLSYYYDRPVTWVSRVVQAAVFSFFMAAGGLAALLLITVPPTVLFASLLSLAISRVAPLDTSQILQQILAAVASPDTAFLAFFLWAALFAFLYFVIPRMVTWARELGWGQLAP
ncbi:MAG: AAA family ATPase [Chloroflexi bacterium]|nr:AAA family ATPase [Chloroflexota bacterium]